MGHSKKGPGVSPNGGWGVVDRPPWPVGGAQVYYQIEMYPSGGGGILNQKFTQYRVYFDRNVVLNIFEEF